MPEFLSYDLPIATPSGRQKKEQQVTQQQDTRDLVAPDAERALRAASDGTDVRHAEVSPTQQGTLLIEKNVPMPAYRHGASGLAATFRTMEVGDSFLLPKDKRGGIASYAVRFPGRKYVSRAVDDAHVRVWRVA